VKEMGGSLAMPDLPSSKSMTTLIVAVKNPLSYATLALLLVAGLAYYANKPLIAVFLLAAYTVVILAILLRSEKAGRAEPEPAIRWYPNIQAIYPDMTCLIEHSIKSERRTSVEVMGLTLYHMWEYVRNFVNEENVKNLDIRFTTISGTPQQAECLKTNWPEISHAFCKSITEYQQVHLEDLHRRGIAISVHKYDHIPMFHGILINGEHLFFSFTSWSNEGHIEGATTFYCYYNTGTTIGKSYIHVFRAWLDHIQKCHPCKARTARDTEQSLPADAEDGAAEG